MSPVRSFFHHSTLPNIFVSGRIFRAVASYLHGILTCINKLTHPVCCFSMFTGVIHCVHVCISGSSSMAMNVSSHMHVRVCGKGKNIIQETEYRPPAISGEITLTHILCIHFFVFLHQSFCYNTLQEMLYQRLCGHLNFGNSLF